MSDEKMREEFEAEWGIEMNPGVYFIPELNVYGAELYAQYEYASQKSSAWFYFQKGWQVSRAALVIDLPTSCSKKNTEVIKAVGRHIFGQGIKVRV